MSERLSLKEKISYGCGDFGLCLTTTMVSTYLMYFYTNVVGIDLLKVGTITLLGGIMDAISDLVLGVLVDHTKSKWGKCRPYLLFMAIPLAVVVFFVFNVPDASQDVKYIYALVTYLIYSWAYTAICIPYQTLMASITDHQGDRLSVSMWKTIGSSTGQFIINSLALTLVGVFGNGLVGFRTASLVFSGFGAILLLICFANTRERIVPPKEQKVSAQDTIRAFNNGPWFIVCVSSLLTLTAVVLRAQQTMYYAQYVLGNLDVASILLTISTAVAIPVAIVTPQIALRLGKRNVVILGSAIFISSSLVMWIAGQNTTLVCIAAVLAGIGSAMPNSVCYVMVAETVDYGEWKQGKRVQGGLMSFIAFGIKIGASLAGMVSAMVLSAGGYVEQAAEQSPSAVQAVVTNYIWLPVIMYAIIIVLQLFYKLDKQYPQIKAELDQRRKEAAAQ